MDVMTVRGPMRSTELGLVQPHEHVFIEWYWFSWNPDHLLNVERLQVEELARFRSAGGTTIFDMSAAGCAHFHDRAEDALALKRVSEATGLNIVLGAGWYREPTYPAYIDRLSVARLADLIVEELERGVGGTTIRAGIIGELAVHKDAISPREERVLRAAARAQSRTGAAIAVHSAHVPVGLAQLDILQDAGADLRRVVVAHCDTYPDPEYHDAIASRGAFVEFDTIGIETMWSDEDRIALVLEMIRRGHLDRLLLSLDISRKSQLTHFGGRGYAHLLEGFLPRLRAAKVTEEQIDVLTRVNPRILVAGS